CQDVVSFTGSASTAQKLRSHPQVVANSVRFVSETDSINSCVLGPQAGPGEPEFDAFVREVAREMTAKAGQKCTAIRKAIVPAAHADAAVNAIKTALGKVVIGDPRLEQVRMGPLAALSQRREVLGRIAELRREAELVTSDGDALDLAGADREKGAFVAAALLYCREPAQARAIHNVEAFGPVCTVMPYRSLDEAVSFARRGEGSLVGSIFTADDDVAAELALRLAPLHGRLLIVNRDCAKESTGHGSPLPGLIHGGPGRAGGGEEMGGIRGLMHYMQRTAIQGSPQTLARITGRWTRGATQKAPGVHPFRKAFHELQIGDTLNSVEREVTLEDIERFAALSGDTFYAHMDEEAARRNP
ncbi:MAG: aldehyde dehydrogenase family protein, partial [Steroidobacteraceae bacterium]